MKPQELELRYLVGYLPHGLRIASPKNKNHSRVIMHLKGRHLNESGLIEGMYSPILRPLSDLAKEIEVNGEKFVPKDVLDETHITNWSYVNITHVNPEMLQDAPFWWTQKLLEWHFDIYGLIEAGLAIDINTLDK